MIDRGTVPATQASAGAGDEAPVALMLERALRVLSHRPAALITDIDGTISPIVAHPADARVEPAAAAALQALGATLDLVAVVTGRDEAVARQMVGAEGVTYVGNYGLLPGIESGLGDDVREARAQAEAALGDLPCVELEDKGTGFSAHYRNCADPDSVRLQLLDALTPIATMANARLMEGKKVIELVPGSLPTKRGAVSHLIQQAGALGVVYLGDDLSDVVVFEELGGLRSRGRIDALCLAVTDAETAAAVVGAADMAVGGVDQVALFLGRLAAALQDRGTR